MEITGTKDHDPNHGNRGIEADNSGDNHEASPVSFPNIIITLGKWMGKWFENQAMKCA